MGAMIIVNIQNCFIFILLCFFSYIILFRKRKDSKTGCKLPPSPPSRPIIGHLHLFLSLLPHKSFQKISAKYGPLLYLRMFNYPIVLVSSASVVYELYKTHDVNVSSRMDSGNSESLLFGSSGFINTPYGDYWKYMKKLLVTKLLRPQANVQSRSICAEELERFYSNLIDKAMKKESVEICKEAMKLNNNTICRMSMGRSLLEKNGEAERVLELVIKSFTLPKKVIFEILFGGPLEKLGISVFKKEIMEVSDGFDKLLERILVEHEEKVEEHQDKDMMDLLVEAYRDDKADFKITRSHIKALFAEIFLGGTDTSAQTVQWTMAHLLNNPLTLKRLREEIDTVVGTTRLIQDTDLPNLPYLQAVVKEALRLHPPAPLHVRTFKESCEFKDFYIPKNTTLVINAYAVMRDPNSWEDPGEFKPERFLTSSRSEVEDEVREQSMKYLPFGGGRRGCPASNLAFMFVRTAIGTMVQCFDWKIKGEQVQMEEVISGVSLTMAYPLTCIPVVRIDPLTFNLPSVSS